MNSQRRNQYRIGRPADKQGPRLQGGNQLEVEKSMNGTSSLQINPTGPQNRDTNPGPPEETTNTWSNKKRIKWSREEYKDVVTAFYMALKNPTQGIITQTYDIWRNNVGENTRHYINANTLGSVRRYILDKGKLTAAEIEEIKNKVGYNQTNDRPASLQTEPVFDNISAPIQADQNSETFINPTHADISLPNEQHTEITDAIRYARQNKKP